MTQKLIFLNHTNHIIILAETMAEYLWRNFGKLLVDRKGHDTYAFMKTTDILGHVENGNTYEIKKSGLKQTKVEESYVPTNKLSNINKIIIKNNWSNNNNKTYDDKSNILGSNDQFTVDTREIYIPVTETTKQNLEYFGAKLLECGDKITIDTPYPLPITTMEIGKNYVKDYLLQEGFGNGCYLEYHDTPHFHMPLDDKSIGYLILGKVVDDNIHLTAFNIPYGKAIYTLPFTIHCDAFLVGKYMVLYTVTPHYSTALLKHNDSIVNVNISN